MTEREQALQTRYRIVRRLGCDATATTFEAEDTETGLVVALKQFSLRGARDWKVLERFQEEARVLASLDHPTIPKYRHHFFAATPDGDIEFGLVQELARGESLAARIARMGKGFRVTDALAVEMARVLLGALTYIHERPSALIHGDIKPQHVVLADDGRVSLVDFGSARACTTQTMMGGATVTGTFGYMAPEQLHGKATPATDLYGLGATILFALTGRHPGDFPMRRGRIAIGNEVSPTLARWIARMLEPIAEDRFASAADALAALQPRPMRMPRLPPRRMLLLALAPAVLGFAAIGFTVSAVQPLVEPEVTGLTTWPEPAPVTIAPISTVAITPVARPVRHLAYCPPDPPPLFR